MAAFSAIGLYDAKKVSFTGLCVVNWQKSPENVGKVSNIAVKCA